MKNKPENQWPRIQRGVESVSLRLPSRFRPLRLLRRLMYRFIPYQPGIYIFTYHKIVDPAKAAEWEIAYGIGGVSLGNFERQIAYLCQKMAPVSLTKAFELMACENLDRPYFVITFDDGFSDVLKNATPVVTRFGIKPCMFVNGRFARGHVYYRVLAALLTKKGHAQELRDELISRDGSTAWSTDPQKLFSQTKNCYIAGIMEDAVAAVYLGCLGEPAELGVHLKPEEIRQLQDAGWEIGNHTFDHRLLSQIGAQQIAETISSNEAFWRDENVRLIRALAIPNGAVKDVNEHLNEWLREHEQVHALFCNGGVNRKYDRTQWLRFFGGDGDELSLHEIICAEADRMNRVWRQIEDAKREILHD
jgi:peptidoglycan/xylan/chitin deacetylase (PgdA/CDA1 family)